MLAHIRKCFQIVDKPPFELNQIKELCLKQLIDSWFSSEYFHHFPAKRTSEFEIDLGSNHYNNLDRGLLHLLLFAA